MRLLLDTHTALWFWLGDSRISANAIALIIDPRHEKFLSPASPWEIAIKISTKKYSLPEPYEVFIEREIAANDFHILHIEPKHTAVVSTMPFHHRDPFDRLLVAQAQVERLTMVTVDRQLEPYDIKIRFADT